ncbi:MAG: hypothetical protein IPJ61_11895 [Tessaracoccus sp.]|uniref:hypothetical protein n=1 Tax=Tessaracoccus sp. TaxID=1971211 RepID=UPI001EB5B0E4|nr:hypothetical protein [Tessaracoccus sp.]MBK7821743.1 hypothetical protein [Tessaracoccus sp.]
MSSISTASPTATQPPALGAPRIVGLIALLLVTIALPLIFLPMEASWGHLVFHLLGIATCVLAVLLLRDVRRLSQGKAVPVLTWVTTVFFAAWLVGHIGELFVVLTHGGAHADHDVFDHPTHVFFASIAVPGWMASVVTTLILLIAVVVSVVRRARG